MAKETLVLLPPMLCDARVFGAQLAGLSAKAPVMVAPTCQGERIEEIASQVLGWAPSKFALAGQGLGGSVALEILRRAPQRVSRVALISTSAHGETPEGASAREPRIVAARSGRFDEVITTEMNVSSLSLASPRIEIGQLFTEMAWNIGPEGYVRQARALQRVRDYQAVLRQIEVPAWVICGAEDKVMPLMRHEFTAEMIQGAELKVLENSGHYPTLERPQAMVDLLGEFLSA